MRVPLTSVDGDTVDGVRLHEDGISLDDLESMAVDGVVERGVARHLDNTHAVAFARLNSDDGEGVDCCLCGVVRIDTTTIDDDAVGNLRTREGAGVEVFAVRVEPGVSKQSSSERDRAAKRGRPCLPVAQADDMVL